MFNNILREFYNFQFKRIARWLFVGFETQF